MDFELMRLDDNVNAAKYTYQHCHTFFKNENYKLWQLARKEFGKYYSEHYLKPEPIKQAKPFLRINDWTETFEEYQF
jgi:hypothetical protein